MNPYYVIRNIATGLILNRRTIFALRHEWEATKACAPTFPTTEQAMTYARLAGCDVSCVEAVDGRAL